MVALHQYSCLSKRTDGSKTTQVRDHNSLNEITRLTEGATQTPFTYDGTVGASNGNLADDGTRKYEYDALNRLTRAWKTPATPVLIGEYTYDALGRRIRKASSNGGLSGNITNGSTDFLYNSKVQCIEERNSSNAATKQMLWGIYVDELIQQKNLVALNNFAANDELYPLQDLLYRTTGLTDSNGTIREAYDCDAYGNTLIFRNTGTPPAEITFSDSDTQVDEPTCEFIYTGRRYDAETENYFFRARIYAPEWGRFLQRDPIGFAGSQWNLYEYVGGWPLVATDPSGKLSFEGSGCASAAPTSDTSGCNVHADIIFLGYDADCICRCAGDSAWDNQVRGCLDCAQHAGVPPNEAHDKCYALADAAHGHIAGWYARIDIFLRCGNHCQHCENTFEYWDEESGACKELPLEGCP